jgi:uncharacterized membrane protein YgcG
VLPATAGQAKTAASPGAAAATIVKPVSGKEGTKVTIVYPSAVPDYPNALKAQIEDPGVHGYVIVRNAGIYVAWDGHKDSEYTVPAAAAGDAAKKNAYTLTIPPGVCGIVIKPEQATVSSVPAGRVQGNGTTVVGQNVTTYPRTSSPAKVLSISLIGASGKPAKFKLACDTYTLSVSVAASPALVQPLPGASTVTATLAVRGPAQVEVAAKLTKPSNVNVVTPLAFEDVMFDTTFGTLAPPAPAKVRTGTDGTASVSVSSAQPGRAAVRGVALGVGDGRTDVQFAQKVDQGQEKPAENRPLGNSLGDQCAAAVQQRHQGIVSGLSGAAPHEVAQALVDSDATNPSVAECARKTGGGGDDTVPAAAGPTGNPALDDTVAEANKSADKASQQATDNATFANGSTPDPKPNPNKKLLYGGLIAAGGLGTALAVGHGGGGGGGGTTTTGGGTTGGGTSGGGTGTGTTFKAQMLNTPPQFKGDASGDTTKKLGSSTNAFCAGSEAKYGETVSVTLDANGSGTITLDDTPNFQRVYNVTGVTGFGVTVKGSGTFSFFGAPIPGTLSVMFTSMTSLTMTETTTYGSCSNTYTGTMTR